MNYTVETTFEDRQPEYAELTAKTDKQARQTMSKIVAAHTDKDGAKFFLSFFRQSDGCRGYLNPDGSVSGTGKAWN